MRWALAAAVAIAVIAFWMGSGDGDAAETPPPSLVGVWTTDDPRYEDRALEVTREALIFRTGGRSLSYHTLEGVVTARESSRTAVTFRYRGGELTVYVPQDDSTRLTIQNRPSAVWRLGTEGE